MNMKKIKKVFALMIAAIICIFIVLFFYIHRETAKLQEAQVKAKLLFNASKKDYYLEFENEKAFCIEKDNVKYSFYITTSGVCFDECEFEVREKGVIVKNGEVSLIIRQKDDGNVLVRYDDMRVVIRDDGTEEGMYCGGYFICNKDFEESSIEGSAIIDGYQKALDAYTWIKKFTTLEELKEQYNKALAICEQLNAT